MKNFKSICLCHLMVTSIVLVASLAPCRAQDNLPVQDKAIPTDTPYNSRSQQWLWNKFNKKEYKSGFKPTVLYNYNDKLYVGVGYELIKKKDNKQPFASQHGVYARYSIPQNAMSFGYYGLVNHIFGKWDLYLNADYDAIRWTNFFGIGNETTEDLDKNVNYYRVRTHEIYAGVGLNRRIGTTSNLRFTPFSQATKIVNDADRFLSKNVRIASVGTSTEVASYDWDKYAGLAMNYSFVQVDNADVPTRGVAFATGAAYTRSLESKRSVNTYNGMLNMFMPITGGLLLASRNGAATLTGDPKFYQMNVIGGSPNVRGYRRDRFRGTTSFYSSNELEWLFDVRSNIFNGKIGPVAFYDIGRVWEPEEISHQWHSGYGGGLLIAPFDKISISLTYGVSKENQMVHLKLQKAL